MSISLSARSRISLPVELPSTNLWLVSHSLRRKSKSVSTKSTQRWLPHRVPSYQEPRLMPSGSMTTKTLTRVFTRKAAQPTSTPTVVSTGFLTDPMPMCAESRVAPVWLLSPTRSQASTSAKRRRRRVLQLPPRRRRRHQQVRQLLPLHQAALLAACKKSSPRTLMDPRWTARLSQRWPRTVNCSTRSARTRTSTSSLPKARSELLARSTTSSSCLRSTESPLSVASRWSS